MNSRLPLPRESGELPLTRGRPFACAGAPQVGSLTEGEPFINPKLPNRINTARLHPPCRNSLARSPQPADPRQQTTDKQIDFQKYPRPWRMPPTPPERAHQRRDLRRHHQRRHLSFASPPAPDCGSIVTWDWRHGTAHHIDSTCEEGEPTIGPTRSVHTPRSTFMVSCSLAVPSTPRQLPCYTRQTASSSTTPSPSRPASSPSAR